MTRRSAAVGVFVVALVLAPKSEAHFALVTPASWMSQDSVGSPQKLGPCGDEDDTNGNATPSGVVTAYQVGDTITITIDEKIFHPGHYRIALTSGDRKQLPAEPFVDAGGVPYSPCGFVKVENPAVFPVLADGVFTHTQPFSSPQTTTVKLPANITCSHCTLQVIEFMSDHGINPVGGCFYHHCADISVGVASDAGTDASATGDASPGGDGGLDAAIGSENGPTQGGCGCSVPGGGSPFAAGLLGLMGATAAWARRRRRK